MSARQPQAARSHAAAAAASLLVLAALPLGAAQMVSPLAGQGKPNLDTTDIYFSMYLDRLIAGKLLRESG